MAHAKTNKKNSSAPTTKISVTTMAKPEIGLSMLYCLDEPFKSLLKRLPELTVKHVEVPDEGLHTLNQRRAKRLKKAAEINIATPSPALRHAVLKRLTKSLVLAGQLDCRLWLFHPGSKTGLSPIYPGKDWQLNLQSVRTLLKVARREGVEIAIENTPEPFPSLMKSADDFRRFYEELGDDIGMVLDVAHANLNNQIQAFLEQFSKKLVHMHVSDNDGANDLHLGIGIGSIDWQNVAKLVKEAEYGNLIVIESTDHIEESIQVLRRLFT
jgi:sugar phosphate isomerase/epimerase